MKLGIAKNIIIILLSALSVFQAAQLLLGGEKFYKGLVAFDFFKGNNHPYAYSELIKPGRIIIGSGKTTGLTVRYNGLENSSIMSTCNQAIKELFNTGEYISYDKIDYEKYFNGNSTVMLEYMFTMPSDAFFGAFIKNGTPRMKCFEAIAVVLSESKTSLSLFFLDYSNQTAYEYVLNNAEDINNMLISAINSEEQNNNSASYAFICDDDRFKYGFLSATWEDGTDYNYPQLFHYLPYEEGGGLTLPNVEKKVKFLFKNNTVMSDLVNGVYTFREGMTTVKYLPNNVLTYSDSSVVSGKSENSFISAFSAAVNMLKSDKTLVNEWFLAGYEENNGIWTFFFDIALNDFPLRMTTNFIYEINMSHVIQIQIENDRVTKYSRLVYNFYEQNEFVSAFKTFITAYTELHGEPNEKIAKADLCYSLAYEFSSLSVPSLKLSWFFATENENGTNILTTCPAQ